MRGNDSTEQDTKAGPLAGIKAGDEVAVWSGYGENFASICKVERLTNQGRPVVGGAIFNSDGYQRGGDRWHPSRIERLTPELRIEVQEKSLRRRLIGRIKHLTRDLESLPTSTLRQVAQLLDTEGGTEKP